MIIKTPPGALGTTYSLKRTLYVLQTCQIQVGSSTAVCVPILCIYVWLLELSDKVVDLLKGLSVCRWARVGLTMDHPL